MTEVDDHKRGKNIWFYRIGIGSENNATILPPNGWKIRTLSSLMEQFNDTDVKSLSFKGRLEMHDWKMTDPQL